MFGYCAQRSPGTFQLFPGAAQCPARAGLLIRQAGQAAGPEDGQKKKARAAARDALLLWPSVCAGGAPSGAFLPFAGGVRFSTLPGSALGVGLELSEL